MLQFCKNCKNIHFYKNQRYCIARTIFKGTLEHTPQNVCLLCNLVRFGLHFLRTFSEANIYEYLSSIFFANFSACGRPFLYSWGAVFGFPPPPPRTKLSACAHEYMMVLLRTR